MAVAITNKYAASSAGGNSGDIIVSAGEAVVVVLLPAAGAFPGRVQCRVQRKLSTGGYQNVPASSAVPGVLSSSEPEVVLAAPGTYRVVVPVTSANVLVEEHR